MVQTALFAGLFLLAGWKYYGRWYKVCAYKSEWEQNLAILADSHDKGEGVILPSMLIRNSRDIFVHPFDTNRNSVYNRAAAAYYEVSFLVRGKAIGEDLLQDSQKWVSCPMHPLEINTQVDPEYQILVHKEAKKFIVKGFLPGDEEADYIMFRPDNRILSWILPAKLRIHLLEKYDLRTITRLDDGNFYFTGQIPVHLRGKPFLFGTFRKSGFEIGEVYLCILE